MEVCRLEIRRGGFRKTAGGSIRGDLSILAARIWVKFSLEKHVSKYFLKISQFSRETRVNDSIKVVTYSWKSINPLNSSIHFSSA